MVLAMELALKLVVLALDDLDMEARVIIAVLEDTVCGLAPGVCVCVDVPDAVDKTIRVVKITTSESIPEAASSEESLLFTREACNGGFTTA